MTVCTELNRVCLFPPLAGAIMLWRTRAHALALSLPCIRAYFIPIRVKRVAGTDGTHTTVYPQLREINLGPISGRPRDYRGTNDFPQRRTRSNETVPLVSQTLLYIFESTYMLRIRSTFLRHDSVIPRDVRSAERGTYGNS